MADDKKDDKDSLPPAQTAQEGSKTPAYVAWLKKNKPDAHKSLHPKWKGKK